MMPHQVRNLPLHWVATVAACTAIALYPAASASAQSVSAPLTVTTLAGTAGQRQVTNGTSAAARFNVPAGLILNASGDLIVADTANNIFRKVTASGVVSIFSGTAVDLASYPINIGSSDGTASQATFYFGSTTADGVYGEPVYVYAIGSTTLGRDSAGNIYFADTLNRTVRKVDPSGNVTTIAGAAGSEGSSDGAGASARFHTPYGVDVDTSGNVYVADSGNNTVRKITPSGEVSTIAGTAGTFGTTDGAGASARFRSPSGIAIDTFGNIYVTDSGSHTIRKISAAGVVTTFAGSPDNPGTADGSGTQARFRQPRGIAVDASGNVYVADSGNHAIRKITPSGTVSTIAGTKGTSGSADGTGTAATFYEPYSIAIDAAGSLYIADTKNHTIRRAVVSTTTDSLQVSAVPPTRIEINETTSLTLKIVASGSPSPSFQWYKGGVAIAGATAASLSITNATLAAAGTYTVVATSGGLSYTSGGTRVDVYVAGTPVPSVTIVSQPTDRSVNAGQSATFTVEAASTGTLSYQWTKNGVNIIGATSATYTITSAQQADVGVYAVTISDGSSTATSGNSTLSVTGGSTNIAPAITTQPTSVTVASGGAATFTVAASGTPAPTFQWQKGGVAIANSATVSGATTATLTITGVTSADAGSYTAVATNVAGSATSNAATLTVSTSNAGRITNISALTNINAGEEFTFGFFVGGAGTSGSKPVLMRAMGPSLAALGVSGTLPDPMVEFYDGETKITENNDWGGAQAVQDATSRVQAFPFVATTSKDAAIYKTDVSTTVGHSIKVKGGTGSGLVIAELYDGTETQATTTPRLINVSLLKHVGNKTTLGFFIGGSTNVRVLIRAIGPTLGTLFNLPTAMADPKMDLFVLGANTPTATNDNWGGTAELTAAFNQVQAFGLTASSKDAAMLQTLAPGGYTVEVQAATGATGHALIEVYEVP